MVYIVILIITSFIILNIKRIIYITNNLKPLLVQCEAISEKYLIEIQEVRSEKFDKTVKSVITPSAIKLMNSDNIAENTTEAITESIPFFKVAKGVFQYLKPDEKIGYLQDRHMIFCTPEIEISHYKNHVISYFLVFLAFFLVIATFAVDNPDADSSLPYIAMYLMILPTISAVRKFIKLKKIKYINSENETTYIFDNHKFKYIFKPLEDKKVEVYFHNKIMNVDGIYISKYDSY